MKNTLKKAEGEKGEITVILVCFLTVLILFLALTIDLGNTYLTHLRMRNAVDLAANALAVQMPVEYSAAKEASMIAEAETVIRQNGIDPDEMTMTCEIIHDEGNIYAARVILRNQVDHYFAQLYLNQFSTIRVGNLVYISEDAASASGYRIVVVDS